jgi:hypothetical protein
MDRRRVITFRSCPSYPTTNYKKWPNVQAIRREVVAAPWRTERFSVRFSDLRDDELEALQALPKVQIKTRKSDTATVALLELMDSSDSNELLRFLNEKNFAPTRYAIWVSVVTESDTGGVAVPDFVLDLIRNTVGGLSFSFVALGPDDSDDPMSDVENGPSESSKRIGGATTSSRS